MTAPTPVETCEAAVLGAAMLSFDAMAGIAETLTPESFARPAHATLFDVLVSMHRDGELVDVVTVAITLSNADKLDEIGGAAALHDLTAGCPMAKSWRSYSDIIVREADRRQLVRALHQAIVRLEAGDDPDEVRAGLDRPKLRLVRADRQVVA